MLTADFASKFKPPRHGIKNSERMWQLRHTAENASHPPSIYGTRRLATCCQCGLPRTFGKENQHLVGFAADHSQAWSVLVRRCIEKSCLHGVLVDLMNEQQDLDDVALPIKGA